jgi:hypothetical protein
MVDFCKYNEEPSGSINSGEILTKNLEHKVSKCILLKCITYRFGERG